MSYHISITETAAREIKRLDLPTKKKVDKAILKFATNPFDNNTDHLVDHPEAQFRHRIGNWRILFDLLPNNTLVIILLSMSGREGKTIKNRLRWCLLFLVC